MGDHVIRHHTTMPGVGKTAQELVATRRLEDSLHEPMITIFACRCKAIAPASSAWLRYPTGPANYASRLVIPGDSPSHHLSRIWNENGLCGNEGRIFYESPSTTFRNHPRNTAVRQAARVYSPGGSRRRTELYGGLSSAVVVLGNGNESS
jgi:hypothetical protein